MSYILIESTAPTKKEATKLAKAILGGQPRLAACVQITGPITSHYHWEGKLEEAEEYRLSIKTHQRFQPEIAKVITSLHPYECPEIITIAAEFSPAYAAWAAATLSEGV